MTTRFEGNHIIFPPVVTRVSDAHRNRRV